MPINAERVHSIMENLHQGLLEHKGYLNGLNVFPVPDGDTGFNMALTMQAALTNAPTDTRTDLPAGSYLRQFARAMLLGSRGCSGVILSLYCKGVAEILADGDFSVAHVSQALENGYQTAESGITDPTEGTILTIMRELSLSYEALADRETDPARIITRSIPHLKEVLDRTPEMLPVLKQAGVVDAGGAGLIILLEGLSEELNGSRSQLRFTPIHLLLGINRRLRRLLRRRRTGGYAGAALRALPADGVSHHKLGSIIDRTRRFIAGGVPPKETILQDMDDLESSWNPDIQYRYCTEVVLDTAESNDGPVDEHRLRALLADRGDSLMVLGDDDVFKIHIHTNGPDGVIELISPFGQVVSSKIDDMKKQHRNFVSDHNVEYKRERSLFCIVSGEGFKRILLGLGASDVLDYGRRKPSVEQLVKQIDRLEAKNVIVASDDRDILMALKYAVSLSKANVLVLESDSVVSLIGMLMGLPENQDINRTAQEMMKRFDAVRAFSVARSVRPTQTAQGQPVRKGEYFALYQGRIVASGREAAGVIGATLESLLEDEALVTIYGGLATKKSRKIMEQLQTRFLDIEFEEYYGGQYRYHYHVSLE